MEWREEGIVLGVRRHGETSVIAEVLTETHGRHAGVVRGGVSRKIAPILQPGGQVDVTWRARLDAHIGTFTVEPVKSRAALVMGDGRALAGLNAIMGLCQFAIPEREPHPELYQKTLALLDMLGTSDLWPAAYLYWEIAMLEGLGFGLDLTHCAVTGAQDDLAFVSPKSGRAVSAKGAGEWADKLLPLPPVLRGEGDGPLGEVIEGLMVSGHFLTAWLAPSLGERPLPVARQRLIDKLAAKL